VASDTVEASVACHKSRWPPCRRGRGVLIGYAQAEYWSWAWTAPQAPQARRRRTLWHGERASVSGLGAGRARRTPEPRAASHATHKHRQIALVPAAAGPSQTNTSVVHTPDQVRNQPASSAHGVSAAVHALNTRARARASNASNNVDKSCKTGHHATGGDDDAKHGTIGATARPDLTSLVPDPAAILRSGPDATQPATRPWRRQR